MKVADRVLVLEAVGYKRERADKSSPHLKATLCNWKRLYSAESYFAQWKFALHI